MSTGIKTRVRSSGRGEVAVRRGSGNVFKDLGVRDSGEALAKAELAAQITAAIADGRLTQTRAARLLGVSQADVSDLVRGKLKGFSTGRLVRFLNALGRDVEIVVSAHGRSRRFGRLRVLQAVHGLPAGRGKGEK
jgi:predicted XRE-type DNA-binding protein